MDLEAREVWVYRGVGRKKVRGEIMESYSNSNK